MENYKNSKIGLETAQKYGDIIEMERPQTEESLRKHPRMTLQNRAKIFSPLQPCVVMMSSLPQKSSVPSV
ncbi:hypothetical protein [Faecalibacterium taiwanense]|uniref:hypothetical protein n=1 Tax=Faecalibacterium taiwanense TaxID=3030638 RepID=UPI00321B59A2